MMVSLPESNKQPGVHYIFTPDGIELPVIDITQPAFALSLTGSEQRQLVEGFLHQNVPFGFLPKPLRNILLRIFLRGSILADGIREAQGSFMTGLHTYVLKLGPQMLGTAYAKPIDRRLAAALPVLSVRLRLQDVAQLMADTLLPALSRDPHRPLYFVNIAGGPAIDTLNAMILLTKCEPGILLQRPIEIAVLDLDDVGPAFGKSALAALCCDSGPLHETQVGFHHVPYNWDHVYELKVTLNEAQAKGAMVVCSSEGGLFEYGSDAAIDANLKVLRSHPEVLAVIGSVTRADEPMQRLRKISTAATRPRGLAVFRDLIRNPGWSIARAIERPFSDQVVLT